MGLVSRLEDSGSLQSAILFLSMMFALDQKLLGSCAAWRHGGYTCYLMLVFVLSKDSVCQIDPSVSMWVTQFRESRLEFRFES